MNPKKTVLNEIIVIQNKNQALFKQNYDTC